jgi:hypothetical protein
MGDAINGEGDLTLTQDIISHEEDPQDVIQMGVGQQDMVDLGLFIQTQTGGCSPGVYEISVLDQEAG